MKGREVLRHRGGFIPAARKLVAGCIGGVLLMSCTRSFANLSGEGEARRILDTVQAEIGPELVSKCRVSLSARGADTPPIAVTLSKKQLTMMLECVEDSTEEVPEGLRKVCTAKKEATVESCSTAKDGSADVVTLKQLLGWSSDAQWVQLERSSQGNKAWMLRLKDEDLPFTDKAFFVGCKKTGDAPQDTTCRVNVVVKARASSVAGNVVTCAYGSDSNPQTLEVDMTQERNTLTLDCGVEGSVAPPMYETNNCEGMLKPCKGNSDGMFPEYARTLWTRKPKEPAIFTIPTENFPQTDTKFFIGCSPHTATDAPMEPDVAIYAEDLGVLRTTECKVAVTVKAANSAPVGSSVQVRTATCGAAALAGLVAGFRGIH
ncbi:SAG-related sequence [Besnoitia besnoiti]|uniref:SAG-related sequence n=1 Tax=Besnoitia besnoiti TaxID=94643 RepID=A0A2A9MGL2_BESBE|nr:SAG-related sequence [Besnoitia besnoiti]PFH37049.1 SAG-related sequence [Besnoitia besnoiti]